MAFSTYEVEMGEDFKGGHEKGCQNKMHASTKAVAKGSLLKDHYIIGKSASQSNLKDFTYLW